MIEIRKVQTTDGHRINCFIPSHSKQVIDAEEFMLFPALIDPHVHFRTPGAEHKENWVTAAKAAIAGGVTTILDMPNNTPSCSTLFALRAKEELIRKQLASIQIPLRFLCYLGADEQHLDQIALAKGAVAALKIYMGSSTGDLRMDNTAALQEAFRLAAEQDVLIAVHAEDEALMKEREKEFAGRRDAAVHSLIRNPTVAARAVEQALLLAEKTGARLYIAHVSTQDELDLIRSAKKQGLSIYAEATPHHLFLDESSYESLGTKGLVNPPLRSKKDRKALWEAIYDDTIDTIGTDHAPHTLEEKQRPYGLAPSGFPSIEFYFALLLNAYREGQLSLEKIVSLTHTRPQEIFGLPINDDVVLVDLKRERTITSDLIRSKAGWSPYLGLTLTGWPRYTVCDGVLFDLENF